MDLIVRFFQLVRHFFWWLARLVALVTLSLCALSSAAQTQADLKSVCPRPFTGTFVPEPEDLRSRNGVLKAQLTYLNFRDSLGQMHYCYRDKDGSQAPNLRVHPGDWLVLTLKNELTDDADKPHAHAKQPLGMRTPCGTGTMDGLSTNIHFHGLYVPPACHQDDVLNTFIAAGAPPFEYRIQIPADQPPGVYWYHPHVHGMSNVQVQGGASGALIVEGIERAVPTVAGLPERVLIIRDQ